MIALLGRLKEINHDKEKKVINYKDAWLEVYDKPIIYFPKFFHPDPTVKDNRLFNASTNRLSLGLLNYLITRLSAIIKI